MRFEVNAVIHAEAHILNSSFLANGQKCCDQVRRKLCDLMCVCVCACVSSPVCAHPHVLACGGWVVCVRVCVFVGLRVCACGPTSVTRWGG